MSHCKLESGYEARYMFEKFNYWPIAIFVFSFQLSIFSSRAQTTLNVTSYGAVGDAQQVWVSTSAGSPVVAFTNALSAADIGKTVELFGVGQTNIGIGVNQVNVTNAQDLIAVITNVVGNNAYLSGDIPTSTSNAVYCIYGTNNVNAFAACIAAAPTNVIIYIPHGTISPWGTTNAYLLIPYCQYTNFNALQPGLFGPALINLNFYDAGITLSRGGLMFEGDGEGQTILMGEGAWKDQGSTNFPNNTIGACVRGMIFEVLPPVTNDYPLVFTNLTFDGGLQNGLIGYEGYQPANPVSGIGWDETHCAGIDGPEGAPWLPLGTTYNSLKIFSSCEFRHFRGEIVKGISGGFGQDPATILVTNCVFWDGNGTAFNYNFAHTIADCTFSNMYQVEEFYLAYPTNAPSWFINNYTTNCAHAFVALNGGTSTNQPYYISNNIFASSGWLTPSANFGGQLDGIITTPACNVTIANNQFICSNYTICIDLGAPGAQGYFANSNIWITGNTFYNPYFMVALFGAAPGPTNGWLIENVVISNNVLADVSVRPTPIILTTYGWVTNILFVNNNFLPSDSNPDGGASLSSGAFGAQYVTMETNTIYWNPVRHGGGPTTNIFSYGGGPWHQTALTVPGDVFVLKDSDSSQIPPGAQMVLDNTTNVGGNNGIYTIYLNSAMTRSQMTTNGQINVFNWMPGFGWTNVYTAHATPSPKVRFTASATNGMAPVTVQFQSPAVDSTSNAITSWNWNFGDGGTSTAQNPSHTYTTGGTFNPTLTFTNANGIGGTGTGAAITLSQVKLGLAMTAGTGTITLAWPTNVAGYALQYATNLSPPVVWRPYLSGFAAMINGQNVVTGLKSGPRMFFRLVTKVSQIISTAQPRLGIIVMGKSLIVTWPSNAVGFILQSTTSLAPPVIWNTVLSAPAVINGQDVVTNPVSGSQMFFRLGR